MSKVQSISKLATPVEVNGRVARFKMDIQNSEIDAVTATDILLSESTSWLFGETKETLLRKYRDEHRELVTQRDSQHAEFTANMAELQGLIDDLVNS